MSIKKDTFLVKQYINVGHLEGKMKDKKVINKNCKTSVVPGRSCIFNRVRIIIIGWCLPTEMAISLYLHIISKS